MWGELSKTTMKIEPSCLPLPRSKFGKSLSAADGLGRQMNAIGSSTGNSVTRNMELSVTDSQVHATKTQRTHTMTTKVAMKHRLYLRESLGTFPTAFHMSFFKNFIF